VRVLVPIKRLAPILGAMALSSWSACAAGIDSRAYSCAALHSLITAKGFVFISNANFEDFVVSNTSYCEGSGAIQIQLRSVPTTDNPECLVNYCPPAGGGGV
jgi:hypothetical protein